MQPEALDVYLLGRLVGELRYGADRLTFVYSADYVQSDKPVPLSSALPIGREPFAHDIVEPYFSGLLPDDVVRERLARYLQISEKNTFRLLEIVGGECAGAISLYKKGDSPGDVHDDFLFLSDEEVQEALEAIRKRPMMAGRDKIRISGAGAQDKLIVAIVDGKIAIPRGNTPSTHIIKPAIRGIDDSVHNELFCMRLAKKVGLDAAAASIYSVEGEHYYLTERYDRVKEEDNTIRRLHQEDFCQALGVPPENKYESEGGPGFPDCYKLIDLKISAGDMRGAYRIDFFKAAVFNFLIGNGDAHGKNISLIYKDTEVQLAPHYDLMSTLIYVDRYKAKMAMKLGGKYKFQDVYKSHLINLGRSFGFGEKFCNEVIAHLVTSILGHAEQLSLELSDTGMSSDIYKKIVMVVADHAKRLGQ